MGQLLEQRVKNHQISQGTEVFFCTDCSITYIEHEYKALQKQTASELYKEEAKLILIHLEENLGFGKANNVALRYISQVGSIDYIWLLNNDTVIYPNTLMLMVQTAQTHSGITGSVLKFYANPSIVQTYGGGYFNHITGRVRTEQHTKPSHLDFINGASLMISKAVLEKVGLLDEQIFMYFEENDYCIRAQQAGFKMMVADACVLHKGGVSGGGSGNYLSWKNVYINKCYVMFKHYGIGVWVLFSGLAWLLNLINPQISTVKRRASLDALKFLFKQLVQHLFKGRQHSLFK